MNIKKIILSLDLENIKKIIVVYDNKIIWYTNKEYNQEQLRIIYSRLSNNLIKENYLLLKGFNKKDLINELATLGKIERNENKLIYSIEYINNSYIVKYEDGTTKMISFNDLLEEISNIYSYDINELSIDKLESIGLLKINKKVKNLKINKRTISMIIALSMMSGTFIGIKLLSKEKKDVCQEEAVIHLEPVPTPYTEEELNWNFDTNENNEISVKKILNKLVKEINKNELMRVNNYIENGIICSNCLGNVSNQIFNYLSDYNFLDDVESSPYLTNIIVNEQSFIVIDTNNGYESILSKIGRQNDEGCYDYSVLYLNGIINNSMCTAFLKGGITDNVISTENEQKYLQIVARELLEGRPSIIRVNGVKKGNGYTRHFVVAVGINENYDMNNLKQSDFLIADPATAGLKILDTEYGGKKRFLLQTKDDVNWCNNEGDSNGYVVILANGIDNYFGIGLEKGIVPWVTYIPQSVKKI